MVDEDYTPTEKSGTNIDEKKVVEKFCEIMSLYSLQYATQEKGNYADHVLSRIEKVSREFSFLIKKLDNANIIKNSS